MLTSFYFVKEWFSGLIKACLSTLHESWDSLDVENRSI